MKIKILFLLGALLTGHLGYGSTPRPDNLLNKAIDNLPAILNKLELEASSLTREQSALIIGLKLGQSFQLIQDEIDKTKEEEGEEYAEKIWKRFIWHLYDISATHTGISPDLLQAIVKTDFPPFNKLPLGRND